MSDYFKKFITWFAPHIRQWAIIYVFLCYGIFVMVDLSVGLTNMENPYGLAMIIIGYSWLAIMKLFEIAEHKLSIQHLK